MGKIVFIVASLSMAGLFGLLAVSLSSNTTKSIIVVNEEFGELLGDNRVVEDFSLDLFDGGSVKLSDLRGDVVFGVAWE